MRLWCTFQRRRSNTYSYVSELIFRCSNCICVISTIRKGYTFCSQSISINIHLYTSCIELYRVISCERRVITPINKVTIAVKSHHILVEVDINTHCSVCFKRRCECQSNFKVIVLHTSLPDIQHTQIHKAVICSWCNRISIWFKEPISICVYSNKSIQSSSFRSHWSSCVRMIIPSETLNRCRCQIQCCIREITDQCHVFSVFTTVKIVLLL